MTVWARHAIDIEHIYRPYIQRLLDHHASVAVVPYMEPEIVAPFGERVYVAVTGTVGDFRLAGLRRQVWQHIGDEAVRLGLGVAVARRYLRRAKYRWPSARILTYESIKGVSDA